MSMKKKLFLIAFLMFFVAVTVFAAESTDSSSEPTEEDIQATQSDLDVFADDTSEEGAKATKKKAQKEAYKLGQGSWNVVTREIQKLINNVYLTVKDMIVSIFPFQKSGTNEYSNITNGMDGMPTGKFNTDNKVTTAITWLLGIFVTIKLGLIGVNTILGSINPKQEFVRVIVRIILGMILLRLACYIPDFIINISDFLGTAFLGGFTNKGKAVKLFRPGDAFMIPTSFLITATPASVGLYGLSLMEMDAGFLVHMGFSGTSLASMANMLIGIIIAVIGTTFSTAMTLVMQMLELYLMTLLFYLLIPALVFNGFVELRNVAKAYFFQGMKIILVKMIVIIVDSAIEVTGIKNALFGGIILLAKAVLTAMLIIVANSLISAFQSGSAVSDSGASHIPGRAFGQGLLGMAASIRNSNTNAGLSSHNRLGQLTKTLGGNRSAGTGTAGFTSGTSPMPAGMDAETANRRNVNAEYDTKRYTGLAGMGRFAGDFFSARSNRNSSRANTARQRFFDASGGSSRYGHDIANDAPDKQSNSQNGSSNTKDNSNYNGQNISDNGGYSMDYSGE